MRNDNELTSRANPGWWNTDDEMAAIADDLAIGAFEMAQGWQRTNWSFFSNSDVEVIGTRFVVSKERCDRLQAAGIYAGMKGTVIAVLDSALVRVRFDAAEYDRLCAMVLSRHENQPCCIPCNWCKTPRVVRTVLPLSLEDEIMSGVLEVEL